MGALPDFLIIGASRCGTTSLYMWLGEHPRTLPPSSGGKEPLFWNYMFEFLGMDAYVKMWPAVTRNNVLRYEASTDYLLDGDTAAPRLAMWAPDCKLIVLLRDPVRRAWSEYWNFWLKFYRVTPEQFEALPDMVAADYEIPTLNPLTDLTYTRCIMKGMYADCLERWFKHVDKDQFFFIRSEDMFRDPWTALKETQEFLGLEVVMPEVISRFDPLRQPDLSIPEMPKRFEDKYREFYKPHNKRLYELLGQDLGWEEGPR